MNDEYECPVCHGAIEGPHYHDGAEVVHLDEWPVGLEGTDPEEPE